MPDPKKLFTQEFRDEAVRLYQVPLIRTCAPSRAGRWT